MPSHGSRRYKVSHTLTHFIYFSMQQNTRSWRILDHGTKLECFPHSAVLHHVPPLAVITAVALLGYVSISFEHLDPDVLPILLGKIA